MGLDSFWVKPGADDVFHLEFDPPLNLCGGMFSGSGGGSFRGKVYNDLIESLSGVSLYQERMCNGDVWKIAVALDEVEKTPAFSASIGDLETGEFDDLARMFYAYAEAGAELRGWW